VESSLEGLSGFFETVSPHLDERQRRVMAGAMVAALGHGGQARVVEATGMSTSTVNTATREVRAGMAVQARVRAPGAGPKRAVDVQPGLLVALDELVHPETPRQPHVVAALDVDLDVPVGRRSAGAGLRCVRGVGPPPTFASDVAALPAPEGMTGEVDEFTEALERQAETDRRTAEALAEGEEPPDPATDPLPDLGLSCGV